MTPSLCHLITRDKTSSNRDVKLSSGMWAVGAHLLAALSFPLDTGDYQQLRHALVRGRGLREHGPMSGSG